MRQAVIVSASRTAVGKANKGTLSHYRSDEMGAVIVNSLLERTNGRVLPEEIDDVIMGCAMPEASQGMNIARTISIRAGLPVDVPGQTVNRLCASGLQSIANAAQSIITGSGQIIVAGGIESMSLLPMFGLNYSPNPFLMNKCPDFYLSMGLTAERVAEVFGVSRYVQDQYAYNSHMRASKARQDGKFDDEIVPLKLKLNNEIKETVFENDETIRPNTNMDELSALRPAFKEGGTVTAGNSSPLSDGAAGVMLMERRLAESKGISPIAIFSGYAVAGVEPAIMGIGPIKSVPKVLEFTGLNLNDIDLFELNEAFASQSIVVINNLGLPKEKVNVNGGAIALGHPLGCTGAKLIVTILHEMVRCQNKYGLVTMCVGGGQGAAAVIERLN